MCACICVRVFVRRTPTSIPVGFRYISYNFHQKHACDYRAVVWLGVPITIFNIDNCQCTELSHQV